MLKNGKLAAFSPLLQITTMDTTSHDFSWETIEFPSPYGSGVLHDVAIVNENDIWAVRAIFADNAKPWLPYNAVHWDGQQWELKRIKTKACGGVDYPPIRAVFAFSRNDILFAHIDGGITYFDGINFNNDCSLVTQLNGSANKMWGRSRNDLYVVSGNGFIAHYNGGSGGQITIKDPWYPDESGVGGALRNRGMAAEPVAYPAPYELTLSSPNIGVFLDQDPQQTPAYYSINAPSQPQTVNGKNLTYDLESWSALPAGSAEFSSPNFETTPVIFRSEGAQVTANMKGRLMSDIHNTK